MKVGGRAITLIMVGQAFLCAGAVLLPWADNEISGSASVAAAGIDTGVIVAFALAAGVALVLQPLAAVRRRSAARVTGLVCAVGAVLAAVSFVVTVSGTTVRAYAVDSAGNINEPAARSHPGAGLWCAVALCVAALAVPALSPLGRDRRTGAGRGPS
jgi:nitrate/nitrite transporter NarK